MNNLALFIWTIGDLIGCVVWGFVILLFVIIYISSVIDKWRRKK